MMAAPLSPSSGFSSPRSSRASSGRPSLSLDLSTLPPLIQPSPPSNTLLITNLDLPSIFEPHNLTDLRQIINNHALIHTWSPLKSMRRVIVSFYDIPSATLIKQQLDRSTLMGCLVRVYFGAPTEISPTAQHLKLPDAGKLFFISPPPSPPHGWEVRNEDPPNKEVHAEDLAEALAKLNAREGMSHDEEMELEQDGTLLNRQRSTSVTVVYEPSQTTSGPQLPAISVEDTAFVVESPQAEDYSPMEGVRQPPITFTATSRPPVELMNY